MRRFILEMVTTERQKIDRQRGVERERERETYTQSKKE